MGQPYPAKGKDCQSRVVCRQSVSRSLGVKARAERPNIPCAWLCATLPPSRL
jgi:hypothetical protein